MAGRKKGTLGVVGLGIMGGSFARNLVESGWRVVGYDLDPKRNRALAKVGVEIASDIATLARQVPTITTSLPSPKALDAVVAALVGAKLTPKVVSRRAPSRWRTRLPRRAHAQEGRAHPARLPDQRHRGQAGEGPRHLCERRLQGGCPPLADVSRLRARATHILGAFGNGSKMKYVANLLVAIHTTLRAGRRWCSA